MKSEGLEIGSSIKVRPVILFSRSLFGQLVVSFNDQTNSDERSTYPYRDYLGKLLSYREKAKGIHLTSSQFYKDTAGKIHVQVSLMGNPGPYGGVSWISNTDGGHYFLCNESIGGVGHFFRNLTFRVER